MHGGTTLSLKGRSTDIMFSMFRMNSTFVGIAEGELVQCTGSVRNGDRGIGGRGRLRTDGS